MIFFPDFLDFLIDADIRNPVSYRDNTRVLIKGRESFLRKHVCEIQLILHGIGTVEFCRFYNEISDYGVICEVEYAFASQAFALQIVMDGMFFKAAGNVTVEVVEREKEKLMKKSIKRHVMEYINTY